MDVDSPVTIEVHRDQGRVEVVVAGELDMATAPAVADVVDAETRPPGTPDLMVLDMRGVSFIDSTGLGMLVRCRRRARADQVRIVLLVQPTGSVTTMLRVSGLQNVFEVFHTPEAATAS